MKPKYTLGPWQVKPWKAANYTTLHIQACNERAEWIARLEAREEQEANARLIAAAPEILEELKRAVTHIRHQRMKRDWYQDDAITDWLGHAETLIAKAEGGAKSD